MAATRQKKCVAGDIPQNCKHICDIVMYYCLVAVEKKKMLYPCIPFKF